jgi:hypothetical protein
MVWNEFVEKIESETVTESELLEILREHSHEERLGCEFCVDLQDYDSKSVVELLIDNHSSRLNSPTFDRELFVVFQAQSYNDLYQQSLYAEALGLTKHADEEMFKRALEGVAWRADGEFEYEFELDDMEETLKKIYSHPHYKADSNRYNVTRLARNVHNQRTYDGIDACEGEFEDCEQCKAVLERVTG